MLSDSNYHDWAFNITARLHSKGLWMLVNGKKKCPSASADQEKWDLDQEMAAGLIVSTLEPGQHVHIQSWQTKVWCILRRLAQSFFNLKTQNYLPYSYLMYYMFPNFETTSSQSSS